MHGSPDGEPGRDLQELARKAPGIERRVCRGGQHELDERLFIPASDRHIGQRPLRLEPRCARLYGPARRGHEQLGNGYQQRQLASLMPRRSAVGVRLPKFSACIFRCCNIVIARYDDATTSRHDEGFR